MKKALLILTSMLLLLSCENHKQSELETLMDITNVDWRTWHTQYMESGASLQLNVYAESQSSSVQRIIIESSDVEQKTKILLDSTLAVPGSKVSLDYYYTLPVYSKKTEVTLSATSYDMVGRSRTYSLTLWVKAGEEALRSIDNVTLYSAASEGKSAFSLTTLQTEYIGTDSTAVAFYDLLTEASQQAETLSQTWQSKSGILFARAENFNFSEASVQSVESIWTYLQKSSTIKELKADDVLLFGNTEHSLGVIKILYIADEPGTLNDRYLFAMKVNQNYLDK